MNLNNNRHNWRNFPQLPVALHPDILRVVDMRQHVVWINSAAAPDANVIYLRA